MACNVNNVLAPNKKESILFKELLKHADGGYDDALKAWLQTRTPKFSNWFRNSKAVDVNGEPQVFYHGSGSTFNTFSKNAFFKGEGGMAYGAGFYLTDNHQEAEAYRVQATTRKQTEWTQANGAEVERIVQRAKARMTKADQALVDQWFEMKNRWYDLMNSSEIYSEVNIPIIRELFDAIAKLTTIILKKLRGVDKLHNDLKALEDVVLTNGLTVGFMLNPKTNVMEANRKKIEDESTVLKTFVSVQNTLSWEMPPDVGLVNRILRDYPNADPQELIRSGGSLYFELTRNMVQRNLPKHMGIHETIYTINTLPVSNYLSSLGIDAVEHRTMSGFKHLIVFNPANIKSVHNNGNFNRHVDNMLFDDRSPLQKSDVATRDYILAQADRIMKRNDNVTWAEAYATNPDAVGSYMNGMTSYILGKATKETAHHEPIHYFLNRMLAQSEYDFLHDYFAKEKGLDPFLDAVEIHEAMTDAAVAHDMGRMTFEGKVARLFDKFWAAIREFFFGSTDGQMVAEMFDQIGERAKAKSYDNLTKYLSQVTNEEVAMHEESVVPDNANEAVDHEVTDSVVEAIEETVKTSNLASNVVKQVRGRFTPAEFRSLINYGIKKYKIHSYNPAQNLVSFDAVTPPKNPSERTTTFKDYLEKGANVEFNKIFVSLFREVNLRLKAADILLEKAKKSPKISVNQPIKLDGIPKIELEMINKYREEEYEGQKSADTVEFVEGYKRYVKRSYDIRSVDVQNEYGQVNTNGVQIPYGINRIIHTGDLTPENADGANRVVLVKDGVFQGAHAFTPKGMASAPRINGVGWYVEFDWKGNRLINEYQTDMLDSFNAELKRFAATVTGEVDHSSRRTTHARYAMDWAVSYNTFPGIHQAVNAISRGEDKQRLHELIKSEAKMRLQYAAEEMKNRENSVSSSRREVGALRQMLRELGYMKLKPYSEYSPTELLKITQEIDSRWYEIMQEWEVGKYMSSIDFGVITEYSSYNDEYYAEIATIPNRRKGKYGQERPKFYSHKQAVARLMFKYNIQLKNREKERGKAIGILRAAEKNVDLAHSPAFVNKMLDDLYELKEQAELHYDEALSEVEEDSGLYKLSDDDKIYQNLYNNFFKMMLSHSFLKAKQDGYNKVYLPTYEVMKVVEGNDIASSLYSTPNDVKTGKAKNGNVGPFYAALTKMKGVKIQITTDVEGAYVQGMEFIEADISQYNSNGVELFHTVAVKPEVNTTYGPQLKDVDKLSTAVRRIKIFVNKQVNNLRHRKVDNKALKMRVMNKLLTTLEGLDGAESIDMFIRETWGNLGKTDRRFKRLLSGLDENGNPVNMSASQKIEELVAINEYLNGYNVLDEIELEVGLDTDEGLMYDESGNQTNITSIQLLRRAKAERDVLKAKYMREGIPLLADWLFEFLGPDVNESAKASGRDDLVVTKEVLIKELTQASKDKDWFSYMFNPVISSSDPVLALFAKALKSKLYEARQKDVDFKYDMGAAYNKFRKLIGRAVDNVAKFNEGIYEFITVPVITTTYDENGVAVHTRSMMKKAAFVQPYNVTEFEKNKKAMFDAIGPKPDNEIDAKLWNTAVFDWYRANTVAVDDAHEQLLAKEDDLQSGRITQSDFDEWYDKNVAETPYSTYFKGDLSRPNDSYLNPKWTTIYAKDGKGWKPKNALGEYHKFLTDTYKAAQAKLPEQFRRGWVLPSVRKTFNDRALEQGVFSAVGRGVRDSVQMQAQDTQYNLLNAGGAEVKFLPIHFTDNLEANEVNLDLASSIMMFNSMANKYEGMNEIHPQIRLAEDIMDSRKYTKTNSKGQPILDSVASKLGFKEYARKGGNHNSTNQFKEFVDSIVYGEEEIAAEWLGIDWNKAGNSLAAATSLRTLAGNLLQGVNNVLNGNIQIAIEAASEQFFNKKNLAVGRAIYFKRVKDTVLDFGKIDGTSWFTQMVEMFDPMQGEFEDNYGRAITGSMAKKLFRTSSLFLLQHVGEHQMLISTMFALMDSTPVRMDDGRVIKLHEAFVMKDGRLTLVDGAQWTHKNQMDFINRMHGINKQLHGVYNKFDKGVANRKVAWRLAFMFRRFLIPGFKRRYDPTRADHELDAITEGYYTTFVRTVGKDLVAMKWDLINNWKSYSPKERQNIKRTVADIGRWLLVATMMFVAGNLDDKDEKNNWLENFLLYQMIRLEAELRFFQPLGLIGGDVFRTLRTPSATTTTIEAFGDFVLQITTAPGETYKRDVGLWKKGDNKAWAKFLKFAGLGNTFTPEEAIKYFNM